MTPNPEHAELFAGWNDLAEQGSYEATYDALEAAVALLEDGGLPLSAMISCYELGIRLAERCSHLLRDAELKITVLEQSTQDDDTYSDEHTTSRPLFDLNG